MSTQPHLSFLWMPVTTAGRLVRFDLRRVLVAACLAALVPLGWRAADVAAELGRERRGAVLYGEGLALYLRGNYAEAAARFRQVLTLAPLAVEAYGSLAEAEFRRGDVDAAVDTYEALLRIYPYTYVGEVYRELAVLEFRAGRLADARRHFEQAVTLDPRDWHAFYLLGHVYRRLGDQAAARRAWRRVLYLQADYQPARDQLRAPDAP